MRALLALLIACDPQPVRVPAYYPKPTPSYAQPGPAQQPRAGDDSIKSQLIGTWSYGNWSGEFYDPSTTRWTKPSSDGGTLNLHRGGGYEHGTVYTQTATGCAKLVFDWQQGTWSSVGNTITLRPQRARARVEDRCDASKSTDEHTKASPKSFSVRLERDALLLYWPNGELYSGPYYRVK